MSSAGLTFRLFGEDVSASQALEKVGGKGKKVAGGISAAFGAMALGSAFKQSMDEGQIEATFKAGVNAIPGVADTAAKHAGALFRDGWGGSLGDVTGAMKAVGEQMGDLGQFAPGDLDKITTSALAVAQVMGVDVVDVTNAAGDAMAHGLAPNAQAALDFVAAGMRSGVNQSGDFLNVIGEFGDTFNRLGIDGPTALGMLNGAMQNGAADATTAAKSVQYFAGVVATDSKASGKAFELLGLDAKDMAAKIAGGGPTAKAAFSQTIEALGRMTDPVKQQQAGALLFGKSWKKAGDETILSLDPTNAAMIDTAGAAAKMGDAIHDTAETKVAAMQRRIQGFMMDVVNAPGPIGTFGQLVAGLGPAGMQMGASLLAAGAALKDLGVVTKIATAVQWLFNAALDANPIGLVVLAIAALIAVFVLLWNNCEGFRNFFIGMWEKIKAVVGTIAEWFRRTWESILTWFKNLWQGVKDKLSAIWDGIKSVIGSVIDWFKRSWENVKQWFSNLWNNVIGWFKSLWNGATSWISGVLSRIGGFFTGLWDGLKRGAQAAWDWVRHIFEGVRDWFGRIFGAIGDTIRGALGFVGDFLKAPINGLIGMVNWMIDRLNSLQFTVPDWVPGIGGRDFGIHLGHISYLAEGGVVMPRSGGTHAVIGEAGEPEAVIPLSKWGDLAGGTGGGTHYHIHLPTGAVIGTADTVAVAVADAVKGARRRGLIPAGAI